MGSFHAVFDRPEQARAALAQLASDGVSADDIEMRSSAPLDHHLVPHGTSVSSRVPRHAVLGAILGGIAFFSLVKFTSEAYPLPTGGMPIVPLPTTGVITFEGVAILAIIFTVATVFFECGLPGLRSKAGPLDHHLADDLVLITVQCGEDASTAWADGATETARS
jgi:hypothetical protein